MGNSKSLVDKVISGVRTFVDNTRQYVGAVADGANKSARNLAVYTVVGAVSLGAGARVAEAKTVNDFIDLINPPSGTQSQFIRMDYSDNLMIRDASGVASVVSKTGHYDSVEKKWIGEIWKIGFAKDMGGYINFGGYANNDNSLSNKNLGYEGYCSGMFYANVFADGDSADEVMIIHDQLGDGIGDVVGGVWTLGSDDVSYWTKDIEFNGIQGNISQLGIFTYTNGTKILPHMTIDAREPRTGSAGMGELVALTENWLCDDCNPVENEDSNTYDCDGADWNYDGKVNFVDFSYMANGWE